MEIVYVYTKIRREFGKHVGHFEDSPAKQEWEIEGSEEVRELYMEKNPCTLELTCIPTISEHGVNTDTVTILGSGMNHQEGGWPRDIDPTEPEQKIRLTKKIEKDEDYVACMKHLSGTVEHAMRQNSAIDIYEQFFTGSYQDHTMEAPSAKQMYVFRDPSPFKRCATSVCWYPDQATRVAVSYSILGFQATPEGMSNTSYTWNVENPNYPEQSLEPSAPLCCLEYNPKDHNIIVGGAYNGLIAWWDTRKGSAPCDCSSIEKSHRDPVYKIQWLQSKTGTECASVSTDGQVLWWDTRKLGEPTESLELINKSGIGEGSLGGVSMEYSAAGGPKFLVGTEQGSILLCNRKGKSAADKVSTVFTGHHGPIYSIERNPAWPKFFLSVGDWTARIWQEETKTPIMTTMYHSNYLTAGCWSPTRPGVFFTSRDNGHLDIWDFAFKQNAPTLPDVKVSDAALQSLRVDSKGRHLAVGAADGSTAILQISEGLCQPQQNEKQGIGIMLERESRREKNLEARAKEMKQKQKREAAAKKASEGDGGDGEGDGALLPELEQAFYDTVGITAPDSGGERAPAAEAAPAQEEPDEE